MTGRVGEVNFGMGREPAFLAADRGRIDDGLATIASEAVPRMAESLRGPVEYALRTAGKRIRPGLCIAAWRAATGQSAAPVAVCRLACSLEIVHTYSLIHDDLPCMDDDDLRRGRPTVHRVYGTTRAVLAGAALLPLAVEVMVASARSLGLSRECAASMVVELTRAAGAEGMVGGQLLDLAAEGLEIDGAALETIHRLKTGALLAASLRVGAIAGEADPALLDALTRYGSALGLAFQIADDLLDVEGKSEDLGKQAGRDRELNKASYPALYGVAGARAMAREKVAEAILAVEDRGLTDLIQLGEYVLARRK